MISDTLAYSFNDHETKLSSANYGDESFLAVDVENYDEDEKSRKKFIQRDIEPMIRKSYEYKRWIHFIKSTISTDFQCYHTGVLPEACTIHIHHHPYTLYDLADIVLLNSESFTSFDIARLTMKLHYLNLVGFVPLCATSHESYHSGLLNIPIELVEGNWKELPNYLRVPDRILNKIEEKQSINLSNCGGAWSVTEPQYRLGDTSILQPLPRHVDLRSWN